MNLLFLLAVTSFWFGCNNAAKEIVKERDHLHARSAISMSRSGVITAQSSC